MMTTSACSVVGLVVSHSGAFCFQKFLDVRSGVDEELSGVFDDGPAGLGALVEGRCGARTQVEAFTAFNFDVQVPLDDVKGFVGLDQQIKRLRRFFGGDVPETRRQGRPVPVTGPANPLDLAQDEGLVLLRVKGVMDGETGVVGEVDIIVS